MSAVWLIIVAICSTNLIVTNAREVTNEDIRDAMLSLVHMVRAGEDKLERHEYRERQLGEQLKKSLAGLDKRHRSLEPLKGMLSRLDERLANVETILIQKDERERIQLQKTTNAIEAIQNTLQTWMATMEPILKENAAPKMQPIVATPVKDDSVSRVDLQQTQKDLSDRIESIGSKMNKLESGLSKVHEDNSQIKELHEKSAKNLDQVDGKLKNNEQLLEKYETHLSELNNRVLPTNLQTNKPDKPDWHPNFLTALETQASHLEQILSDLKSVENKIQKIPEKKDVSQAQNNTMDTLQEIRYELATKIDKNGLKLDKNYQELEGKLKQSQEELTKSVSNIGEMSETVYGDVAKSYEQLRGEVQALAEVEKVMIQTADNVLDTKRRVEYGVHQILLEVGNLVKQNSKELNSTLNERFDNIELTILDNQTGALANLSSKLEQEMSQVWRQIGIMYQELTASTTALDRLQEQTETYVNGSLSTMDSMEGKVGQITGRMSEVDENLNYLLGRLSLVTQEFNQIKTGLGTALDNIRSSFQTVQDKIKDSGPGPHKITEDPNTEK